ncbi:MAG: hypothetical protein ABJG99_15890 [Crocinitomicaceae bacterium]
MSPTQKGAFCKSCKKEVFDFTKSSVSDIKETLVGIQNPCVRITQQKLDELNFFEWFNHLNLKKKLKYVFLFAFLIAQNSLKAQESNCYEPQFVAVDSVDILLPEDVTNEILKETEADEISNLELDWEWPEEAMIHWIPKEDDYLIYGGMWVGSISIPEPEPQKGVPFFIGDVIGLAPKKAEFSDEIQLRNSEYQFKIINDTLVFDFDAIIDHEITLKITQDQFGPSIYPNNNVCFLAPIKLTQGKGRITYPVNHFLKGSYSISIINKGEMGVARITKT